MPVRVTIKDRDPQTHMQATHYIVDPQGLLHIYAGHTNIATYREWDNAVTATPTTDDEPNTNAVPRGGFGST